MTFYHMIYFIMKEHLRFHFITFMNSWAKIQNVFQFIFATCVNVPIFTHVLTYQYLSMPFRPKEIMKLVCKYVSRLGLSKS